LDPEPLRRWDAEQVADQLEGDQAPLTVPRNTLGPAGGLADRGRAVTWRVKCSVVTKLTAAGVRVGVSA